MKFAPRHRRRQHLDWGRVRGPEELEARRLLAASSRPLLTTPLDATDPTITTVSGILRQPPFTASQVFNLQSKPNSDFTIYLDFDGHVTTGTDWNLSYGLDRIVSPPFDLDGDPTTFSQMELQRVLISWQRTAEDFAPFDINVTTRDPGEAALINSGSGDTQWGARAIVTVDNFADCGCGGFAYLYSFGDAVGTPTFIFNLGEDSLGETFTHEVGHMLGLVHDGLAAAGVEYYRGHGTGPVGWGAIMGAPFTKNITQWDRGEYFDANNQEDDLQVITSDNGFTYRSDDYGNTRATAAHLNVAGSNTVNAFGILETSPDADYFRFETGPGSISMAVSPLDTRPNVDLWAGLYSAAGILLAESNPSTSQSASINDLLVSTGTYYLRVEGIGSHDTYDAGTDSLVPPPAPAPWTVSPPLGYPDYGSLGQYAISGSIVAPGNNLIGIAATDADQLEGSSGQQPFTFTVTRSGDTAATASVSYALASTLPVNVGDSYPSLATASDFATGTTFSGVLNFAADEVSKTLTLPVLGDTTFEQDEYFDIVLSSPSAGWKLSDTRATGIIRGDENVVGLNALSGDQSTLEGPFDGALIRWRQIGAANGAFDEWAIDNVSLTNSTFADDFDPTIDFANWTEISNGSANGNFVGSQGNALFMSGGSDRRIVSRLLNAQPGDILSFRLIFGDGTNGGENADPGEDVLLEYSLDAGTSWTEFAIYDTEDYTDWTDVEAMLPAGIDTNPPASLKFTVERDGGLAAPITVDWQVDTTGFSNPASANDFPGNVIPSGQLSFDAGESSQQIVVTIQGDLEFEPDEQFSIRLTEASGNGTVSLNPQLLTASGTIVNDDASYLVNPGPQFRWRQLAHNDGSFDEWGLDNVSLTRGQFADDFDPTIDGSQWIDIENGIVNSNFGGTGQSLFFTGGPGERLATSRRVVTQAADVLSFDLIYGSNTNGGERPEPGEEVVLEYSNDNGLNWIAMETYPLPNANWSRKIEPLPPGAIQSPTEVAEGNSGSTPLIFQIVRSGETSGTATIDWSVTGSGIDPADAVDFVGGVLPSGSVTFGPGDMLQTVTVQVRGDNLLEPDETFDLVLDAAGSPFATATILNDDSQLAGDFNEDGLLDCLDVDALVDNIAGQTGNVLYDLTGDGQLTTADLNQWLTLAGAVNLPSGNAYLPGDADLSGAVDGSDFSIWNSNRFTVGAGWCGGDFNADGSADGSDFSIWNNNKFTSSDQPRGVPSTGRLAAIAVDRLLATAEDRPEVAGTKPDRQPRVAQTLAGSSSDRRVPSFGNDWRMRHATREEDTESVDQIFAFAQREPEKPI